MCRSVGTLINQKASIKAQYNFCHIGVSQSKPKPPKSKHKKNKIKQHPLLMNLCLVKYIGIFSVNRSTHFVYLIFWIEKVEIIASVPVWKCQSAIIHLMEKNIKHNCLLGPILQHFRSQASCLPDSVDILRLCFGFFVDLCPSTIGTKATYWTQMFLLCLFWRAWGLHRLF